MTMLKHIGRQWFLKSWYIFFLSTFITGRLLYEDFESFGKRLQYGLSLDNQHIVMIGDSMMRYQYLALAYLVHSHSVFTPENQPMVLVEQLFDSWLDFHKYTNKVLYPNEYCDCYRVDIQESEQCYENRYYHDPVRNISLSFLLYFGDGDEPIHFFRGHWQPGDAEGNNHFHAPDNTSQPYKWQYKHVDELISNIAAKLNPKPTTLVLNAGHWVNNYLDVTHREKVINTSLQLFDRVIWKTTSGRRNEWWAGSPADAVMCAMDKVECLNLSWTLLLRTADYVDYFHYQAGVYTDINIQFLRQLSTGHAIRYTPLPKELIYSIVEVPHEGSLIHYIVDNHGILRKFTMPARTADSAQQPCILELQSRHIVKRTAAETKRNVGGDNIPDICAYLKQQEIHNGDIVRGEGKSVYLIEDGKRREFNSFNAFVSRGYDFDNVRGVDYYTMAAFQDGEPLL